jgi:cytochrome c biogenesis protein CcmG, thiol:disulfide interchange protein DsbE
MNDMNGINDVKGMKGMNSMNDVNNMKGRNGILHGKGEKSTLSRSSRAILWLLLIGVTLLCVFSGPGWDRSTAVAETAETAEVAEAAAVAEVAEVTEVSEVTKTAEVEEQPHVGYRAPDISLPAFTGKHTYHLREIRKPVIVNFWASWCEPCHIEAPDLVQIHKHFGDQVEIWGVNATMGDSQEQVAAFIDKYKITFPVLVDPGGETNKKYGVMAYPTTFIIDGDGMIRDKIQGMVSAEQLDERLSEIQLQKE